MKILGILLGCLLLATPAWATIRTAADCQQATVQALHDNGSTVAGDILVIPAGSCTWTGELSLTKQIELRGTGTLPAIGAATSGNTNIAVDTPSAGATLSAREAQTGNIVISNINFTVASNAGMPIFGVILIMVNADNQALGRPVVIHHITMDYHRANEQGIRMATARGVIYRSKFLNDQQPPNGTPGNTGPTIQCKGGDPYAQANWASASSFGTDDTNGDKNLYIETSTFTNHGIVFDADDGCRLVARYNTLTDAAFADHGHDTSGVGVRHYELYNNTLQCVNDWNFGTWYGTRGGTGVITDNIVPTTCYGRSVNLMFFQLQSLRRMIYQLLLPTGTYTNGSTHLTGMSSTVGMAAGMGTAVTGVLFRPITTVDSSTQLTIDQAPGSTATGPIQIIDCYPGPYPWLRQHGWGWDSTGSDPTPMNNQKLEPIYIWNNTVSQGGASSDAAIGYSDPTQAAFPDGPCAWPTFTGTISGTSVTSITPGTSAYFVGLAITGTGVPANTTVASVDSSTSLTLSQSATAGTVALTLNNNNITTATYVQQNREYYISVAKPSYTKYTYPHPLATVTGGGAPSAPTGFSVN